MNEFSLIEHFFKPFPIQRNDVLLGIGDDAACLQIPSDKNLLVSTDTLVSGVHFLPEWNPSDIAYRTVMVNVSDMAAMAAEPCWATLALTLPELNPSWLESFAQGLKKALQECHVTLVGGDTTKGPLSLTLTIMGMASHGKAVKRSGANSDDIILVSGPLGAAALAVKFLSRKDLPLEDTQELMDKLLRPKPRLDLMSVLQKYASSAIDISDGLGADLNHICVASKLGACITQENIPVHSLVKKYCGAQAVDLALSGGDDYELCFTVPAKSLDSLMKDLEQMHLVCYPIGVMEKGQGLRMKTENNNECRHFRPSGYSHF